MGCHAQSPSAVIQLIDEAKGLRVQPYSFMRKSRAGIVVDAPAASSVKLCLEDRSDAACGSVQGLGKNEHSRHFAPSRIGVRGWACWTVAHDIGTDINGTNSSKSATQRTRCASSAKAHCRTKSKAIGNRSTSKLQNSIICSRESASSTSVLSIRRTEARSRSLHDSAGTSLLGARPCTTVPHSSGRVSAERSSDG